MSCYRQVYKKSKRKFKNKGKIIILIFFIILIFIALYISLSIYKKSMNPTLLKIAEIKVRAQTALIINQVIVDSVGENVDYDNLISIKYDDNNNISLFTVNSAQVNSVSSQTAILVQNKLFEMSDIGVEIPWGTLSGIPLLSNKGQTVTIQVNPIPTTTCNFTSQFLEAGVNQTLHRIYINVNTVVDLVLPSSHSIIETTTPVLLCENLIVGEVPQMYLGGTNIL